LTEKILKQYKAKVDELKLIPSDGGRFELSIDGDLVYSKLATGQFPDEEEIIDQISKRVTAAAG
jgi:selenoprotein W-related protein|tara:strand:+ start:737 stop:928 length:192 start_codon:yes stop_codon:yes gene_type:complete